ncbi:MmcQ/YjbR family DNA-binding protein [Pseudactinotalea sp.]|uniref:MmcQ/YjbR family DNA-binding protein n=1 Tax=Pseudactinotalea sp. TaxID=1926260 RepID=UPI003B3A21B1
MAQRPDVPDEILDRLDAIMDELPQTYREGAWVGQRWRVGSNTVAHVFGGEDQQFRIVFHGDPDEVAAYEHLGHPYFRTGWGANVIGMIIDDETDWDEVVEMLTDSYRIQAPASLAADVIR